MVGVPSFCYNDCGGLNLVLGADGKHRYGAADAYIDELR